MNLQHGRHQMTRRAWTASALALAATGAVAAAGCASGQQAGAPASSLKVKPGTTVRLHVRAGNEVDTLNERIPVLEQQQNLKVAVEPFPQNEYPNKIQVLVASDSLGDVIWGASSTGLGAMWANSGVIRFVDEFVKVEKFDLTAYYPAALESAKLDGKLYGLPYKLQPGPMAIYYNVDAFTKVGQTPPDATTTFDQLVELARRMTQPGTMWGFFSTGENPGYQWVVHFTRAWGVDILSDDGKKSQISAPKAAESLQWYRDLILKHQAAPPVKESVDFVKGQMAMMQSGSWSKSLPLQIKGAFQVMDVLMPKGPSGKRGSMGVTDFLAVTRASKNVAEAWALTKHLTDKETGIRLGEGGATGASGTCGGRKDVFQSERLLANPLHKIWIDAVDQAMPLRIPWNFLGEEHQSVMNDGLNPMLRGETALNQSTLAELDKQLQVVLEKPRPGT